MREIWRKLPFAKSFSAIYSTLRLPPLLRRLGENSKILVQKARAFCLRQQPFWRQRGLVASLMASNPKIGKGDRSPQRDWHFWNRKSCLMTLSSPLKILAFSKGAFPIASALSNFCANFHSESCILKLGINLSPMSVFEIRTYTSASLRAYAVTPFGVWSACMVFRKSGRFLWRWCNVL